MKSVCFFFCVKYKYNCVLFFLYQLNMQRQGHIFKTDIEKVQEGSLQLKKSLRMIRHIFIWHQIGNDLPSIALIFCLLNWATIHLLFTQTIIYHTSVEIPSSPLKKKCTKCSTKKSLWCMAYCTLLLLFPFVLTLFWVIMPGKLKDPTCPVYLICSKFWNSNGPIRLYDCFWDGGRFSVLFTLVCSWST